MKLVSTHRQTDALTGEVISETSTIHSVHKLPKEPEYIKLYVDHVAMLHGLKSGHRTILLYVAAMVGYDGFVVLNARRKEQIALSAGASIKSVENALSEFVKASLLRRVGMGDFELNPFIFGKGEWKAIRERQESFVTRIRFGPGGMEHIGIEIEGRGNESATGEN